MKAEEISIPDFRPLKMTRAWFNEDLPPVKHLLSTSEGGILPLGRVALLRGNGGTGKSQLLVRLAASVASGSPFLGHFTVATPGHVLLMTTEQEDELHRQYYRNCQAMSEREKDLVLDRTVVMAMPGVSTELTHGRADDGMALESAFSRALRNRLNDLPHEWSLIIIDPLFRFAGTTVNPDVRPPEWFTDHLRRFCRVKGNPAVVAAHQSRRTHFMGDTSAASVAAFEAALMVL